MRLRNIPGAARHIEESPFVIGEEKNAKGKWREIFGNDHPIAMEIGMGKGRFLMELAEKYPEWNYIGIEKFSSVLFRAVQKAEERLESGKLPSMDRCNFRFLRMDAEALPEVFEKGEVEKIYLNFSDPWPKERHRSRRLTSGRFLDVYEQILESGKLLEFKTDNPELFSFSLEEIKEKGWELVDVTFDLHKDAERMKGNIMTEYEERFSAKGAKICKLIARVPAAP